MQPDSWCEAVEAGAPRCIIPGQWGSAIQCTETCCGGCLRPAPKNSGINNIQPESPESLEPRATLELTEAATASSRRPGANPGKQTPAIRREDAVSAPKGQNPMFFNPQARKNIGRTAQNRSLGHTRPTFGLGRADSTRRPDPRRAGYPGNPVAGVALRADAGRRPWLCVRSGCLSAGIPLERAEEPPG
jgi:hypothetical protein